MSGKDKRSLCWGTALFVTAGSAVYLGIHWAGAIGAAPYGLASLVTVLLLVLVYAGHQAGVDKPKLVYVREDATTKKEFAEAYVDEISGHDNLRQFPGPRLRPGNPNS